MCETLLWKSVIGWEGPWPLQERPLGLLWKPSLVQVTADLLTIDSLKRKSLCSQVSSGKSWNRWSLSSRRQSVLSSTKIGPRIGSEFSEGRANGSPTKLSFNFIQFKLNLRFNLNFAFIFVRSIVQVTTFINYKPGIGMMDSPFNWDFLAQLLMRSVTTAPKCTKSSNKRFLESWCWIKIFILLLNIDYIKALPRISRC